MLETSSVEGAIRSDIVMCRVLLMLEFVGSSATATVLKFGLNECPCRHSRFLYRRMTHSHSRERWACLRVARARAFDGVALSCVLVCCGLHFLGFAISQAYAMRQSPAARLHGPRTKLNSTYARCNYCYCRCRFSEAAFPQRFSSHRQRSHKLKCRSS